MPKTRRTRKRTAKADTTKAEEAVQKAPREALQMCIDDMELQVPKLIKAACRKFEREAMKCIRQLPDKASIPSEIYNMKLSEYIARGGTVPSVMQSLKEELESESESAALGSDKENRRVNNEAQYRSQDFVTPAVPKRVQELTTGVRTSKRLAKQSELIKISMESTTGSPLSTKDAMEQIVAGAFFSTVLSQVPKKSQPKVTKAFQEAMEEFKGRIKEEGTTSAIVTPALRSTRAKRK